MNTAFENTAFENTAFVRSSRLRQALSRFVSAGVAAVLLATMAVPHAHAQSEELPLGSSMPAPDAELTRLDGTAASASDLMGGSATVFVFWSNQCPWVDRYEDRIQAIASDFRGDGVRFLLVNANDAATFPKENLEASRERADAAGYDVTYVRDDGARLAAALGASRTPHVFVFDDAATLVYAGAVDDSPASAENVEKPYLRNALQAVTSGESVPIADTKAFGCTLKFPN